jgi:hypothetical protein
MGFLLEGHLGLRFNHISDTTALWENGQLPACTTASGCTPFWAAACETSALLADFNPNLQSISRARIRLSVVYSLTAFIRLCAVLGGLFGCVF